MEVNTMEKISNIVRGNARVSSADVKSSSAVRPGALSFGRDVGTSTGPNDPAGTTASRAASLQSQMAEQRRSASDKEKMVAQMSDSFFMSRMRRPEDGPGVDVRGPKRGEVLAKATQARAEAADEEVESSREDMNLAGLEPDEKVQPSGYTPRGSYVDVRA
jgi:hypothetical protein